MPYSFPFAAYLCTLLALPSVESIRVEPLHGGLTNYTTRVIFEEPVCLPGSTSERQSVIVKHAPPYIASLGPDHALSTVRQTVEANVLKLFSDTRDHPADLTLVEVLRRHPGVRVPELLYHDGEKHVIIMSDLGRLPTLLDYLTNHATNLHFASVLGEFLADLYRSTCGISEDTLRPFENEDSSDVIKALVTSLPGKLLKTEGVPDAQALGKSVEEDMAREKQERCFGMVDLWPGSILIGEDFIGLVDWEYAGKSSAGSELGMLTAHLRIPLLSPIVPGNQLSNIFRFMAEFLSAYATHSPPRSREFIHSALVSHGRELINAIEFQDADLAGDAHKTALIQSGARCLRAAACLESQTRTYMLTGDERELLKELI